MTFSIAAFDPENGDLGIAVQSKFPNVGVVIPFARAGIGAIATQSYCNTSFGPRGLMLLQKGASPQEVVDELIAGDEAREYRQLAVIDAQGNGAAYTGAQCFEWCGSIVEDNFSVQGNCLASDAVANNMAQSSANPTTVSLPRLRYSQRAYSSATAVTGTVKMSRYGRIIGLLLFALTQKWAWLILDQA